MTHHSLFTESLITSLQILHPETLEEMPTVRTGLEGTLQAEQVAKEAQEKVWGARDRGRRQAWGGVAGIDRKVEKEAADVRDREQHAHEEVDDHLPEGFTFADLPRFKKIHGWDKENKQLRYVCSKYYVLYVRIHAHFSLI